jgi:hypothetical protein
MKKLNKIIIYVSLRIFKLSLIIINTIIINTFIELSDATPLRTINWNIIYYDNSNLFLYYYL